MKTFPYILFRIGGFSLDELQPLQLSEGIINNYLSDFEFLQKHKNGINDFLNQRIQNEQDYGIRKLLKRWRNDIYNDKSIRWGKVLNHPQLNQELYGELVIYKELLETFETSKKRLNEHFVNALPIIRQNIQRLSLHPNLQNGLILSAPSLLERIKKFNSKSLTDFRKKEFQTERTVMKYLTRIATKTSPFSTFNQIGALKMEKSETSNLSFQNLLGFNQQSIIRLNNYLLYHFKRVIFSNKNSRIYLQTLLNQTLEQSEKDYHFLTNKNNIEAFQTIDHHPVIELIIEYFQEKNRVLYKEVIEYLQEFVEADFEELDGFVFELVEVGLLEFDLGISNNEPDWLGKLLMIINNYPQKTDLSDVLGELRPLIHDFMGMQYLCSNSQNRDIAYIREISEILDRLFTAQSLQTNFKTNQIIYEDCKVELSGKINSRKIHDYNQKLNTLLQYLAQIHGKTPSQINIFKYFKANYKESQSVKLFDLYREYSQYLIQSPIKKTEEQRYRIENWQQRLGDFIQPKINRESVELSMEDLQTITSFQTPTTQKSYAAFVQFYENNQELKGVVNATFPGHGKYFSRFLHLLDNNVTLELLRENSQDDTAIHAEISDASYFNANIHPSLMPLEVVSPQSSRSLPEVQQISVKDLEVELVGEELILKHIPTGKRVFTYDLGFQSFDGRSELFKLLNTFSPAEFVPLHYITNAINQALEFKKDEIQVFPRVIFENQLILQRQTWLIYKAILPKFEGMDEAIQFLAVQKWRLKLGLPQEIFVTIAPRELTEDYRKNDDYKPQYIDFRNPILVQIFIRSLKKVQIALKIEEMLPASTDLQLMNNKPYVTECLVQFG